jgi:PIN domain nuclease of toxin-antitoxin system
MVGAGFGLTKNGAFFQLTPAIAVKATQFDNDFPGDPADRIIAATSILESAALITTDSRIRN